MGACISKCMPNKRSRFNDDERELVQDKLVISQVTSCKPPSPLSYEIPPPPSDTSSSRSAPPPPSFFTTGKSNSSTSFTSLCSLSSTASSGLSSKDRSFSNDFLLSCVKENPHILRVNSSVKESSFLASSPDRIQPRGGAESPARQPIPSPPYWQPIPQKVLPAMQKRVRSSSPNLTRQKSMRVTEPESHPIPSRALRSPSPSRRFEGADRNKVTLPTPTRETIGNRRSVAAAEEVNSVSLMPPPAGRRNEHSRPASPSNNPNATRFRERSTGTGESFAHRPGATVEEIASKFSSPHGVVESADSIISNPHISLDCFIFL